MPAPLLNPDNKLLSWSIADIGLYGAAITPATIAAAEDNRAAAIEDGPPASADLVASDPAPSGPVAADGNGFVGAGGGDTMGSAIGAPTSASLEPIPFQLSGLQAPSIVAPPLALDVGGGSGGVFVPAPVPPPSSMTMPATASDGGAATLSPPTIPIGSMAIDPALAVSSVQPLADALFAATAASLDQAVQALDQTVGAVAGSTVAAGEALSDVVGVTTDTLDVTLATVTPQVASVIDTLADTTTTVTADVTETLATSTTPATDLLTGIGGIDPAGGVATLVDMVAAADEYDLTQIATAPIADSGSIVDLLAVDATDPSLLGDATGDGHDHHDDGPVGLFGL